MLRLTEPLFFLKFRPLQLFIQGVEIKCSRIVNARVRVLHPINIIHINYEAQQQST